jgi:hypothetical protein
MQIALRVLRSIAAIVVGVIVSIIVIFGVEAVNGVINAPPGDKPLMERMQDLQDNPKAMKAWIESLPTTAMFVLILGWQVGSFLGGGASALIAGRARLLHAAPIGAFVLAGTIANLFEMKRICDYTHPDWVIITALLLPLPSSLVGGKLVSMLFPPPPATAIDQPPISPQSAPDTGISEGLPPYSPKSPPETGITDRP